VTTDRPALIRAGLYLAVAAIAVNAPRLVLAFLAVDGIDVGADLRAALLGLTGLATGVVLTGGGAYLAHALASSPAHRTLLAATWLLVLGCAAVLVTPMLVAGLAGSELHDVLPSPLSQWTWSAVAVVAVELVAAGAMVAYTAQHDRELEREQADQELLELARERDRLRAQLGRLEREGPPAPHRRSRSSGSSTGPPVPCRTGCGLVGRSAMAERGHQRSCPLRPPVSSSTETDRQAASVEANGLRRARRSKAPNPS
jgi:hypothetical protein